MASLGGENLTRDSWITWVLFFGALLIAACFSALLSFSSLQLGHDVLYILDHAPDAGTVNYTGTNRLPTHMERGSSSSSEIPAALDGSQGDVAACLSEAKNLELFPKLEVATSCVCGVCLEDMLPEDEEVKTLRCMHQFHLPCIKKWLEKSHTCPYCRDFVPKTPTAIPSIF